MAKAGEDGVSGNLNGNNGIIPSNDGNDGGDGQGKIIRGFAIKALALLGGAFLIRRLTKRATRFDHTRKAVETFCGEKYSTEQAIKDPLQYFNIRLHACPAGVFPDGSQILYSEQAFWRTPERPYRQRFVKVKPCAKDMNCDVEMASYAVKDVEQFRNFCDRKIEDRPSITDVEENISEHLFTVHLKRCERGRKCLYEGSTSPGGFPQNYNGATYSTCEVSLFKNGEIHQWDRGFNEQDAQVFGPTTGPYEFKPQNLIATSGPFSDSLVSSSRALENKAEQTVGDSA